MLGYSDSNKDGGYLAVQLGAVPCQQRLVEVAGRPACGCGCSTVAAAPSAVAAGRAITRSSPSRAGSVEGGLRITEQGEMISAKFADPERARQNLEALVAATVEADRDCDRLGGRPRRSAVPRDRRRTRRPRRRRAYRALVYETPGFVEWFRAITPLAELSSMNIGWRPASRTSSAGSRTCARSRGCSAGASAG